MHDERTQGIARKCDNFAQVCDVITPDTLLITLMTSTSMKEALANVRQLLLSYKWISDINFTSDVIMLDIFLENNKGFQQVSFIGNAIYLFLQDVEKRGFVSSKINEWLR